MSKKKANLHVKKVASVGNYNFRTIFDAPHQWNFCIRPWIHLDYFADFCAPFPNFSYKQNEAII